MLLACFVVTLEDRLPGPGFPRGTSGSMSSVFVAREHRGRGLARAVVSAGLTWLDEMSAEVVVTQRPAESPAPPASMGS
jgi:GNAT superfamily N-acetyltransferase